jgi:nucleoside-diphosphate-sugar epimerase
MEECLQRGWTVTAIVRPGRGKLLRHLQASGGKVYVVERCVHGPLGSLRPTEFDAVINLVGPGKDSWETNWQANVEYVRYLTALLKHLSVGRVVHFSSVAVYGTAGRKHGSVIREEDNLAPDDWYGITKVLGERILRGFHEQTGIPVAILRPSWVIGRGSRLLDRYLLTAARLGVLLRMLREAPLNTIYVRDAALAGIIAASNGSTGFRVYNINALRDQRFGDLVDALQSEVPGFKIPILVPELVLRVLARVFGSLRFLLSGLRFDASKARDEIGFVPLHDIRSAIRELVCGAAGGAASAA